MLVSIVKKVTGQQSFETYDIVHDLMRESKIEFARGFMINHNDLCSYEVEQSYFGEELNL